MTEQLTRLKDSNLPVICKQCRKEFRGAPARQHSEDTGHMVFYPKPASIQEVRRERI